MANSHAKLSFLARSDHQSTNFSLLEPLTCPAFTLHLLFLFHFLFFIFVERDALAPRKPGKIGAAESSLISSPTDIQSHPRLPSTIAPVPPLDSLNDQAGGAGSVDGRHRQNVRIPNDRGDENETEESTGTRADFFWSPRKLSCEWLGSLSRLCIYSSRVGLLLTILKLASIGTPLVTAHARNNLRSSRYCRHCHSSRHDHRRHPYHRKKIIIARA